MIAEAIDRELTLLAERTRVLEQMKTLAEELAGIGGQVEGDDPVTDAIDLPLPIADTPSVATPPRSSSSTRSRKPATSPVKPPRVTRDQVYAFVVDRGQWPVKAAAVVERFAIPKPSALYHLGALVKDGRLIAVGSTADRAYDLPVAEVVTPKSQGGGLDAQPQPAPPVAPRPSPPPKVSDDSQRASMLRDEILKSVDGWADPVTPRTVAGELMRNQAEIAQLMRTMSRDDGPLIELHNAGVTSYRRRNQA